jgi:hypothetical protein
MRWYDDSLIESVWFSPALGEGKDWLYLKEEGVRVYVMRGTKELLFDEGGALAKGMKEGGVEVVLRDVSCMNRTVSEEMLISYRILMGCMLDRY